jgi:peroxiredoxin
VTHTLQLSQNTAPDFSLEDAEGNTFALSSLIGERGTLLVFLRDTWKPASIKGIMFSHRQHTRFAAVGVSLGLIIADEQHTLYGFHMSNQQQVRLPMLADTDHLVHRLYAVESPSVILVNHHQEITHRWVIPDQFVWPNLNQVMVAIRHL